MRDNRPTRDHGIETGKPSTPVLFIGGVGRSGTTLLERVLARLDGVVALGEVMHLWSRGVQQNQLCGCTAPFWECPFWTGVGNVAFGGWENVDTGRVEYLRHRVDKARHVPRLVADRSIAFRTDVREYVDYYTRIYHAAAQVSGTSLVIDSSKQVSMPFCLSFDQRLDVKVLHVVRDPRGVAYSWTKEVERPEIRSRSENMPTYRPMSMSLTWMLHNAEFELLASRSVLRRLLRYEDFARDPQSAVEGISAFLGHRTSIKYNSINDRTVELRPDHTVAGNPMRFAAGAIEIRQDEAWRAKLPATQRRAVSLLTWPLAARYGYMWRGEHV